MVEAQAVEGPVGDQRQDAGVRVVEDVAVLDPHPAEAADGEEAPVVELLVGAGPVREAVVLALEHLGEAATVATAASVPATSSGSSPASRSEPGLTGHACSW
jgi:hypothetical protein